MTTTGWNRPIGLIAAAFGLLTILSGGMALFGGPRAAGMAGDAVPFVLWFNFAAGFAYVAAGTAIVRGHRLARPLAWAIALATLTVFAAFGIAVSRGVPYEMRTVGAMTLRTGIWLAIALWLGRTRA
jgi:hypothetical protein